MITIVDYGMGNLRSVAKGFERFGFDVRVTDNPKEVENADKLVLPGVGAFLDAMSGLRHRGLIEPVVDWTLSGKPFLGICLGLQLLFSKSYEDGEHTGLGIIPGKVVRFDFSNVTNENPLNVHRLPFAEGEIRETSDVDGMNGKLKVPHMGWNQVCFRKKNNPILKNVPDNTYMYFVHSYYVCPEDEGVIATETDYGIHFTSMIWYKNIFATQFHPEKSQRYGLAILENFGNL
jgi:glutamine amidotransferase